MPGDMPGAIPGAMRMPGTVGVVPEMIWLSMAILHFGVVFGVMFGVMFSKRFSKNVSGILDHAAPHTRPFLCVHTQFCGLDCDLDALNTACSCRGGNGDPRR